MPRELITTIIEPTVDNTIDNDSVVSPESFDPTPTDGIDNLISTLEEGINTDDTTPETGFAISFTPDKTYDLDEIVASISRDNADYELVVRVNPENIISILAYAEIEQEILIEYSAASVDEVLDYQTIFNSKLINFDSYAEIVSAMEYVYYPYSVNLEAWLVADGATFEVIGDYIKQTLTPADLEGQLLLDEKQEKIKIDRANLKKYLFDEVKSTDKVKPILNYTKAMTQWTELGLDGTTESDFDTIELYEARIAALEERIIELS